MRRLALTLVLLAAASRAAFAGEICGDGLDNNSNLMTDEGCNPAGITHASQNPLDSAITGEVSPTSGNITYTLAPDVSPTVPYGPPLTFQRFYMSLYEPGGGAAAYRKPLGPHWGHNFASWLDRNTTPNPDQVVVHTTDGRDVMFQFDSTSGGYDYYLAQEGYHVDYLRQSTSSPYNWELRSLTGTVYVYNWSSPTGKLVAIKDSLATPNQLTITYNGSGQVDKVVDASGKKQLVFVYTGSVVTGVNYQTVDTGTATTRVNVVYAYDGSSNPTSVTILSTTRQTMAYSAGYLTTVSTPGPVGGSPVPELALAYLSATPGTVVRSTTALGDLGFEYGSSRGTCSGGSLVYFNRIGTTACDDDSDCGSDYLCGGETNFAGTNTGVCYRAARCLQLTTPDEHLIDTVAPLPATTCTGACAETTEYDWGSTPDLAGIEQADGTWTSFQRNSDGLVTLSARGDTDSDPTNSGGQKTWTFYGNSSFPGRVTEVRRVSELKAGGSYSCDASTTTDCARTLYTWNSDGLLGSRQELGFTLDSSGATISYSYTTAYTYDSKGRMTQIDGPLSGSNDVTDYTYWSSSDVFKNDYRKEVKRKKDATNYLVTTLDDYDSRGNAASQQDPDATFTCFTFSSYAALVTTQRVAMAGQTSCTTSNGSDLTTTYTYDEWFRLTKTQRPLGNCEHREYDSKGRLSKVKERDDCTASSTGDTIEYFYGSTAADQVSTVQIKNAAGTVTREYEYTYHDGMQLSTDINPVNKSYWRSYTYNADGLLAQVDHENSLGKTTWTWDSLDREDTVDLFKTVSTSDEWDSSYAAQLGRPIEVEDDDGKSLETIFDDLGRKVKTVSPDSGTTLFVFDAAGRMVTKVEADGLSGEVSHSFTYDHLGRRLTEDYGSENCGAGQPVEVEYVYDAPPVSCPGGASCALASGRLAYVKSTLLCSASYGDNALNQEVFYGYDDAGRTINEWIQDDSSRSAEQLYTWDKNGNSLYTTGPSGAVNGLIRGSAGSNSNTDKVTELHNGTNTIAEPVTWRPFGPVDYYQQRNVVTNSLEAVLTWNTAYRPTQVKYWNGTTVQHQLDYTEDAKGRTTLKDYGYGACCGSNQAQDSHITYDWLDRVVCDASASGTCPTTSGGGLRNNLNGSPPYTASNDRTQLKHYNSSFGTYTYTYTLETGRDQIDYFTTSPSTGTTSFGWDDRGNRTSDDSNSYSHDARNYSYEGRRLVRQITGDRVISAHAGTWGTYTITNAYDHKGRRTFKSFVFNGVESHWFFYYNLRDQLIEVKYTPNISSPSTYSLFDFYWIEDRPIAYYQIDYPAVTTSRRYMDTDADNRVIELWTWPSSGSATRVWVLNPDAFGWDKILTGTSIFQPLRGVDSMEFYESHTEVDNDSTTALRPPLHLSRVGFYDPLTASVLQVDPTAAIVASYLAGEDKVLDADGPPRWQPRISEDWGEGLQDNAWTKADAVSEVECGESPGCGMPDRLDRWRFCRLDCRVNAIDLMFDCVAWGGGYGGPQYGILFCIADTVLWLTDVGPGGTFDDCVEECVCGEFGCGGF